jgi:Na+/H+ antiporter NhaD/arsenite permease-like protein
LRIDETLRIPLRLEGKVNFLLLAGVVLSVAFLVPGHRLPMTNWIVPDVWLRECVELTLTAFSYLLTPRQVHKANQFNLHPITEVAFLFLGVFITMQIPIEILRAKGMSLGVDSPMEFFWTAGALSSFLDNAPTYVVFFELAGTLHIPGQAALANVVTSTGHIGTSLLLAVSCGSVFMGANTYIGNGPNFLVKSIAEGQGVKMPSFFGYMLWSSLILLPIFAGLSLIFFR